MLTMTHTQTHARVIYLCIMLDCAVLYVYCWIMLSYIDMYVDGLCCHMCICMLFSVLEDNRGMKA